MKLSNLNMVQKGALFAIPASIVLIPFSYMLSSAFGANHKIFWFLIPEFWTVFLSFGLAGGGSVVELVVSVLIALVIFLVRICLIGAFLGYVYSFFIKCFGSEKGKTVFWILFLGCFVLMNISMTHRNQDIYKVYYSMNSPDECADTSNESINNFDENRCYKEFAIRAQDVSICDRIVRPSIIEKEPEDFKAFCYESVADLISDSSICALIPEVTGDENKVARMYRRDGCFQTLGECEKLSTPDRQIECRKEHPDGPRKPEKNLGISELKWVATTTLPSGITMRYPDSWEVFDFTGDMPQCPLVEISSPVRIMPEYKYESVYFVMRISKCKNYVPEKLTISSGFMINNQLGDFPFTTEAEKAIMMKSPEYLIAQTIISSLEICGTDGRACVVTR